MAVCADVDVPQLSRDSIPLWLSAVVDAFCSTDEAFVPAPRGTVGLCEAEETLVLVWKEVTEGRSSHAWLENVEGVSGGVWMKLLCMESGTPFAPVLFWCVREMIEELICLATFMLGEKIHEGGRRGVCVGRGLEWSEVDEPEGAIFVEAPA